MSPQSFAGTIICGLIVTIAGGLVLLFYTRATDPPKPPASVGPTTINILSGPATEAPKAPPAEPPPAEKPEPPAGDRGSSTQAREPRIVDREPVKPEAPPVVSVAAPIDPDRRAQIVRALAAYSQELDIDPGNRNVARAYVNDLAKITALHDAELACSSLEHWTNYAANHCSKIHGDVLRQVDVRLDDLRAACPTSALDHATLLRCAGTP